MALNVEGKKCPVCNSYLFNEDDLVFCPVCGAPHHRDCYNAIGHCAYESTHGTAEQYNPAAEPKKEENGTSAANHAPESGEICPNCKNRLKDDMLVCPYCGRPRSSRIITLDPLGGIKPEEDLGGVTAEEAAKFIKINSIRYIPKFFSLTDKKLSWNWAGFLLPEGWFFSRKMYKTGFLFAAIIIACELCVMPLIALSAGAASTEYADIFAKIFENLAITGNAPLYIAAIGSVSMLITRIVAGLFGDSIYKSFVISSVKNIKEQAGDVTERRYGGVNLIALLLGVLACTYLPEIISAFIR